MLTKLGNRNLEVRECDGISTGAADYRIGNGNDDDDNDHDDDNDNDHDNDHDNSGY